MVNQFLWNYCNFICNFVKWDISSKNIESCLVFSVENYAFIENFFFERKITGNHQSEGYCLEEGYIDREENT